MKHLRTVVLPLACFATCWLLAAWLGGFILQPRAADDVKQPGMASSPRPSRPAVSTSEARLRSLRHDFERLPTDRWAARWQEFAQETTPEELTKLRKDASAILATLADEQIAQLGTTPSPARPAGLAALAESDPETAWQRFRELDPNAILRTLAANNPEQTLQRLRSVPELVPVNHQSELARAALWRTPYGSLFGAWARRAPAAAAEAIATLPRSFQVEAANGLALTWACHDGPAALRFVLEFNQSGRVDFITRHIRLDIILRTALILQPAETARLLASRAELREAMSHFSHVCLKPWYHADPDGALAWMREAKEERTYHFTDLADYLFRLDPAALDGFLTSIRAAGDGDMESSLVRIARHDPAAARDVAERHGLPFPESSAEKERLIRIEQRPDLMLADFLKTLPHHSPTTDPDARETPGWSEVAIYELALRIALLLPEQAPRLAAVLPAPLLAARFAMDRRYTSTGRPRDAMLRFWPELHEAIPLDETAPPAEVAAFSRYQFHLDPLATAESLLTQQPLPQQHLPRILKTLYQINPAAARSWTARLDPGPSRDAAELWLATLEIPQEPLSALRRLDGLSHLAPSETAAVWRSALRRILHQGGDCQSWLARAPGEVRDYRLFGRFADLDDFLAEEARLRKLLESATR